MNTVRAKSLPANYKWVIVALCFLTEFLCLGFCSSNKSIYLSAITEANNIPRGLFSINDSLRFITTAVTNVFFSRLVTRFGTKKLMLSGVCALMISCLLYALAGNIFVFYAGGIMLGVGFSWTTTTLVGWVIGKWFRKNKGTVMGGILAANGLGAALATQIVSPIIYAQGDPFGYKKAYLLITGLLAALMVILFIFYREAPDDGPGEAPETKVSGKAERSLRFVLALVCIFFTGMVLQGITGVAAAHFKDTGIAAGTVAAILSLHSLFLAGSKFLSGFLYDRFGLRVSVLVCDVFAIATLACMLTVSNSPTGQLIAYAYTAVSALALPLETVMLPIFAMDMFDKSSYAKNLGLFVSVNTAGYALGSPVMNFVFDKAGTYKPMFFAGMVLMLLVTATFLYLTSKKSGGKENV